MRRPPLHSILALLLLLPAANAAADLSKLDGLARMALDELRRGPNTTGLERHGLAVTAEGALDVFIRGNASREELEAAGARVRTALPGVCTAYIPLGAVEAVAALATVERIEGSAMAERFMDVSVPASGVDVQRGAAPLFPGINGTGVLVGAVDTGIDLNHTDFKDEAGNTRLVGVWDQTIAGTPPAGFAYAMNAPRRTSTPAHAPRSTPTATAPTCWGPRPVTAARPADPYQPIRSPGWRRAPI